MKTYTKSNTVSSGPVLNFRMRNDISHFSPIILLTTIFLCSPDTTKPSNSLCPKHCICMPKEAHCSGQGFSRVPRHLPPNAETIHLQKNTIRRLKYSTLEGLHLLKHLLMRGNDINYIEPGAFRDMTNLVALSLTENNIRKLHRKTFKGLSQLRVLSLRKNRLAKIDKLFHHMHSLQLLNLGSNNIQEITQNSFMYNWRLQVLDLHDNKIKHIDKHSFRTMPLLKYLVLRDNPLKQVALDFRTNFHLELLDFTSCQLKTVVKGLPHSISDLRLSENRIQSIQRKDFRAVKKIRLLVLNGNKIERISDRALSGMWRLYEVYLGKNELQQLPKNLPGSLHGLYANYNNITSLPDGVFHKNTELRKLYLRHNQISKVSPTVFQSLIKLRNLDLNKNSLRHLRSMTFRNNNELELLDLSNNPIQTLDTTCFQGLENLHILQLASISPVAELKPAIFQNIKQLLFLDLSNSSALVKHMTQNPYVLDYLYPVQDLNLMNNELRHLPSNFPTYFPFLKMVKLVGNPWHCDASLYWMTRWMQNSSVQFFAPDHMLCASPEELKRRNIITLTAEEVHWHMLPTETLRPREIPEEKGKMTEMLTPREPPSDLPHSQLETQWRKVSSKRLTRTSQKHPNSANEHHNKEPAQEAD